MSDDTLFAGHQPQRRQPKPGPRLWTMTKGWEEARAELRDQGVAGVELQVFRGDDFANGRLYPVAKGCARGLRGSPAADDREGLARRISALSEARRHHRRSDARCVGNQTDTGPALD